MHHRGGVREGNATLQHDVDLDGSQRLKRGAILLERDIKEARVGDGGVLASGGSRILCTSEHGGKAAVRLGNLANHQLDIVRKLCFLGVGDRDLVRATV